jgi:hypothetical protein
MSFTPSAGSERTLESLYLAKFCAQISNLYVRSNLSPPLALPENTKRWLADGIAPSFCLEQIRTYLEKQAPHIRSGSGENTLPILDRLIRQRWFEFQYPQTESVSIAPRPEGDDQERRGSDEPHDDPIESSWTHPAPLRRTPALSKEGYAIAFLRRELADGELSAAVLLKRAKAAQIAERTLDRARKVLGVVSRRTGFGRTSQAWVSLPESRGDA